MSDEQTAEVPAENSFLLKERFEIRFGQPLPEFDSNGAKAYEVKDHINPQRQLFALVCGQESCPRLSYLPYLKSIDVPNILKLVEYGIVPNEKQIETMALIYNKPTGARADIFNETAEKITKNHRKKLYNF